MSSAFTSKNSIVTTDIYHIFIILPSHVANSNPCHPVLFSACCLFLITSVYSRYTYVWVGVFTPDLSLCDLCFSASGEMAWCWICPCCRAWATSDWWRLSRWRRSVVSRTSTAASPCLPEVQQSQTLANSLSEVNTIYLAWEFHEVTRCQHYQYISIHYSYLFLPLYILLLSFKMFFSG